MKRDVYLVGVVVSFAIFVVAACLEYLSYHSISLVTIYAALITLIIFDHLDRSAREKKIHEEIDTKLLEWKKSIPAFSYNIDHFKNSEEAMHYLVGCIPRSRLILNTRVVLDKSVALNPVYVEYDNAIRVFLSRGFSFHDLVSRDFVEDARTLTEYSKKHGGEYACAIVPESAITINFTVLKFQDGSSEVLFGWSNSYLLGADPVFRTPDQSLVLYFDKLHSAALNRYGRKHFTTNPLKAPVMSTRSFPADPLAGTYNRSDPRSYFRVLAPLHYRQPEVVAGFVLKHATNIMAARQKDNLRILDFACGYGAVGALLKFDITSEQLYTYYGKNAEGEASEKDKAYFAKFAKAKAPLVIGGLDIADKAVEYAVKCGFLDIGFNNDLMKGRMSYELAEFLASVDLIVEAGAVYAAARASYERMLEGARGNRPWLLFGPRGDADTQPLWEWLEKIGYKLEDYGRTREPYRRLSDTDDHDDIERRLRRLGREPNDYLMDGWLFNDLFLAKP